MSRRTVTKLSIALGATVLLAGCSNWSASPPMQGQPIGTVWTHPEIQQAASVPGGDFNHAVAYDYSGYTTSLANLPHPDYVDEDYFSRKGLKAEHGGIVPPEQNSNWAIGQPLGEPVMFRDSLAASRVRLVSALDNGGRQRFPALAARTQVNYDCWTERTEQDGTIGFYSTCHKDFDVTLSQLEKNLGGTAGAVRSKNNVYFEFDKSDLTPQGREIVDQTAAVMQQNPNSRIALVGKADLAGTDPYNMALSHRRANTVETTLIADGVQANRINETWVGERQPPVPTADGVRELRNRVVESTIN